MKRDSSLHPSKSQTLLEKNMPRSKLIAILEAIFAVTVWGASFVATKIAVQEVSPVTVVWLRFTIGVVILGLATLLRRQFALPERGEVGYLALLGFLGITFHQWLQSTGLVTAQATTTAWIVATMPIFIAILGWLVLEEKLNWRQGLGIAAAVLGALLVLSKGDLAALAGGRFGTRGDFLVMLSAPNWAVFTILSRRGLRRYPATRMMFFVMVFGWLFSSVLLIIRGGLDEWPAFSADGWLSVGFLGVFCSGLAYIFWYDALKALPAAQAGAFLYLEPFVTVIVAALILGEPLLGITLLGGAAILLGVWIVNRPKT
jgi:drug/metabolite transporter (DMT)-like permease